MDAKVMFSSKTDDWETPQKTFDELDREFHFTTDVAAPSTNFKVKHFYDKQTDGLKQGWTGTCWMNPPYGRAIGDWVKKAYEHAEAGEATTVCLLLSRTDTKWWHDYCMKATDIRFIKGRLKFGGSKNSAPFPSVIVIFKANERK